VVESLIENLEEVWQKAKNLQTVRIVLANMQAFGFLWIAWA
jgi:hypothetical protein